MIHRAKDSRRQRYYLEGGSMSSEDARDGRCGVSKHARHSAVPQSKRILEWKARIYRQEVCCGVPCLIPNSNANATLPQKVPGLKLGLVGKSGRWTERRADCERHAESRKNPRLKAGRCHWPRRPHKPAATESPTQVGFRQRVSPRSYRRQVGGLLDVTEDLVPNVERLPSLGRYFTADWGLPRKLGPPNLYPCQCF